MNAARWWLSGWERAWAISTNVRGDRYIWRRWARALDRYNAEVAKMPRVEVAR